MTPPDPAAPARQHPRSRLVLTVAWLLATVLAGTVAWWAVTAVGGERGGEGVGLVSQAEVARRLAEGGAGADGGVGPGAAGPDASPTTTPSPGSQPSPEPTTSSTAEPTDSPSGDPAGEPPPTSGPDPAPAPPADVARTWDVMGGQVGAVCTGASIGLLYATPAAGWSVEVEHAGPAELEVEFSRDDADSRLRAECVGGIPEVTRSGGDDDDRGGDDDGGGGDDD